MYMVFSIGKDSFVLGIYLRLVDFFSPKESDSKNFMFCGSIELYKYLHRRTF